MIKKILIVEDLEVNIDLLIQLLEEDFTLVVARDGAQGVALAQQELPDLILMDMSLPVMDGWEATRQIRLMGGLNATPIIGLSAHAMSGDAERAIESGCSDYLTKPINDALLFEKIQRLLAGS